MQTKTIIQEAEMLYQDWSKRKGWGNTTVDEDALAKMVLRLIRRLHGIRTNVKNI